MDEKQTIIALEEKVDELTKTMEMLVKCQEEEYRTVSADLHDELGQSLTAALLRIKMLQGEEKLERIKTALNELEIQLKDTLAEVRRFTRFLRPIILETMGLIPALEWYVENYEAQTGIRTYFKYNARQIRFPEKVETHAYRILQEAMNNIYKYANATMVSVGVSYQEERFVLSIRDNGCGFDLSQKTSGLGLAGMRQRAYLLKGTLIIRTAPGKGTHIVLDCMVPQTETKEEEE